MTDSTMTDSLPDTDSQKLCCKRCGHEWISRCGDPKRCPSCSSYLWNEPVHDYVCKRCGHVWRRRGDNVPLICPKCKTVHWNDVDTHVPEFFIDDQIADVLRLYDEGVGCVKICMDTKMSASAVLKVLRRYRSDADGVRM